MTAASVVAISGASRGIGRATALRFARDGSDVSFCYHANDAAAQELTKEIESHGVRTLVARADVTDPDAVRSWVETTEADLGPIDTMVACAGITRDGPLAMMSDDRWRQVVDTNLGGVFQVCRAVVFRMMKRRRGAIVAVSSIAGVRGNRAQTNYSASKAGIIGFTHALAKEVGAFGVRVNSVAPGLIDTDMVADLKESVLRPMIDAIPLGRLGRPEEVADLIAFLCGDQAAYITGTVAEIHGGIAL